MDFYNQSRKYGCILWRTDGEEKAEDGAVFGIWGTGGPHHRLAFRVEVRRESSDRNEFPCLQSRTGKQLAEFLQNNGVYVASIREAEAALRHQLETGTSQWDTYGRWKFPEGVQSSIDSFGYEGVDAHCAGCYTSKPRCEEAFRLRKLVLKPSRRRQFRVSSIAP